MMQLHHKILNPLTPLIIEVFYMTLLNKKYTLNYPDQNIHLIIF
jgi:hypothetical protein